MKIKIGLLSVLMFAGVLAASAQGQAGQGGGMGGMQRRTPEELTKRVVDTMTTVFKLDQNQQTQANTIFTDFYKARTAAMQSGNRPDRDQMEKMTTERDEKLKKVLGDDQFKKFKDEIEPALRPRRPAGQ